MTVRTRFAPSPTGYLHVGGIRTALFAWLLARQHNGQFILRLEDTDKNREVEGSADHLIASLKALGLQYDEGPDIGGEYGPYRQSDRLETYKQWAQKLIDKGFAYADPYTAEEVQKFREEAQAKKQPFLYRKKRPNNPPAWDGTTPLRFKSDPDFYAHFDSKDPITGEVVGPITDEVMGELNIDFNTVDDFILIKSDGYPTYNFAHIVDDAEMKITHVIRGQEFISSMPNYLNLYHALDLPLPKFAHMPHIMNEQGNKKLSKRDGAKDILDYIRDGYLPEALLSFIATLGWNDGTEQEVFTRDELIAKFSLDRVQKSGARFDEKRLLWMNGQFIRELTLDDLAERIGNFWPEAATTADQTYKKQVLALAQDRLKTLADLPALTEYFFAEPAVNWQLINDNKQLKKLTREEHIALLKEAKVAIGTSQFDTESLQTTLNELLEQTGQKPGTLFSLIRFAITWAPFSPGLPETMAILGKEAVLRRIEQSITQA